MRTETIVLNSYETMGVTLYEAEFTAQLNLQMPNDATNCYVKVMDFNISNISSDQTQAEDTWKPQLIYNLVSNMGQISTNRGGVGVPFLASKFYHTTYGLPSPITNPVIKLATPPNGIYTFKIVEYRNKLVRHSTIKNIGNIQVILEFIYE